VRAIVAVLRQLSVRPLDITCGFLYLVLLTVPLFPKPGEYGFYLVEWSFFFFAAFLMYVTVLTFLLLGQGVVIWDRSFLLLGVFLFLGGVSALDAVNKARALVYLGQYVPYFFLFALILSTATSEDRLKRVIRAVTMLAFLFIAAIVVFGLMTKSRMELNKATMHWLGTDVVKALSYVEFPACLVLYRMIRDRVRGLDVAFVMLLAIAIALTGSRGSFAALLGMVAVAALRSGRPGRGILGVAVVGAALVGGFALSDYSWARISGSFVSNEVEFDRQLEGFSRLYTAKVAWTVMTENWANGVGPGNLSMHTERVVRGLHFPQKILDYWDRKKIFETTTAPLKLGAELGVGGVVFFLAFYLYLWRRLRGARRRRRGMDAWLGGAEVFVVSSFLHSFVDLGFTNYYYWFYYGIVIAIARVASRQGDVAFQDKATLHLHQESAAGMVVAADPRQSPGDPEGSERRA
jgi:hypothetical protein